MPATRLDAIALFNQGVGRLVTLVGEKNQHAFVLFRCIAVGSEKACKKGEDGQPNMRLSSPKVQATRRLRVALSHGISRAGGLIMMD
jgi:hypothetical protein